MGNDGPSESERRQRVSYSEKDGLQLTVLAQRLTEGNPQDKDNDFGK